MSRYKVFVKIFLISSISILYSLIVDRVLNYFGIQEDELGKYVFENKIQEFVLVLLVAPIFETFVFQFLIYYILYFIFKNTKIFVLINKNFFLLIYLILSSTLFAISHSYSKNYIYIMIIPGVVLAFSFYYFKKHNKYPFWYVSLIHFIHNGFVLIYSYSNDT
jgi:hypothetical protein